GEISELSRRAASVFSRAGVQRGDGVLVILPRLPEWWMAILGLIRLGAVPIPGTPFLTDRDISYRIGAADVRAIVAGAETAAKVGDGSLMRFLVGGSLAGWIDFDAALHDADPTFDPPPTLSDDPGLIFFTSGTT